MSRLGRGLIKRRSELIISKKLFDPDIEKVTIVTDVKDLTDIVNAEVHGTSDDDEDE